MRSSSLSPPISIPYHIGINIVEKVIKAGSVVVDREKE